MPRIDTFTAQGRDAIVNVSPVSPRSFGGQVGQGVTEFGKALETVGDKLQQQKDDLDLVDRAADFDEELASKYQEILSDKKLRGNTLDETMTNKTEALKNWANSRHRELADSQVEIDEDTGQTVIRRQAVSNAVGIALRTHAIPRTSSAIISMQADVLRQEANLQGLELTDALNKHVDFALRRPEREFEQFQRIDHLVDRARAHGVVPETVIHAEVAKARDRFWRATAEADPRRILSIWGAVQGGEAPPEGMDQSKLHEYSNIAVGRIHAQEKQHEADIKANQATNSRTITAAILRGEEVGDMLPQLLADRGLEAEEARTLADFAHRVKSRPNNEHLVRGLAETIEVETRSMKFRPGLTLETIDAQKRTILRHYLDGRTTKEETGHLLSVWQETYDSLHQEKKESRNTHVAQAHELLRMGLETAGPFDKFDAFASNVKREAFAYLYREVDQRDGEDPRKIAQEADGIFRPLLKDRMNIGKKDQALLDDATMLALVKSGRMSKATYHEYVAQSQGDRGREIVSDTLKNLPVPPEPTFLDHAMDHIRGLMGGKTSAVTPAAPSTPQRLNPRLRK